METSILITGASGYVGANLAARFFAAKEPVRLAGRRADLLAERFPGAETARLDVMDAATLRPALEGVRVAYYLVHSMGE